MLVTDRVVEPIEERGLACEPIGEVSLKGFPAPTPLFVVRRAMADPGQGFRLTFPRRRGRPRGAAKKYKTLHPYRDGL